MSKGSYCVDNHIDDSGNPPKYLSFKEISGTIYLCLECLECGFTAMWDWAKMLKAEGGLEGTPLGKKWLSQSTARAWACTVTDTVTGGIIATSKDDSGDENMNGTIILDYTAEKLSDKELDFMNVETLLGIIEFPVYKLEKPTMVVPIELDIFNKKIEEMQTLNTNKARALVRLLRHAREDGVTLEFAQKISVGYRWHIELEDGLIIEATTNDRNIDLSVKDGERSIRGRVPGTSTTAVLVKPDKFEFHDGVWLTALAAKLRWLLGKDGVKEADLKRKFNLLERMQLFRLE